MKVIFDDVVEVYLNELIDILYEKEYFGFKATAYDYVGWIIDSIEKDIAKMPYKVAPPYFSRYGKNLYYSVFKRNNETQWYVFLISRLMFSLFDILEVTIIVQNTFDRQRTSNG